MVPVYYFLQVGVFHHRVNYYFSVWAVATPVFIEVKTCDRPTSTISKCSLLFTVAHKAHSKLLFLSSLWHMGSHMSHLEFVPCLFMVIKCHFLHLFVFYSFFSFDSFVNDFSENLIHEINCLGLLFLYFTRNKILSESLLCRGIKVKKWLIKKSTHYFRTGARTSGYF